ncbi:Cd(II)/Pb(II)-responsive transcriptional regulator [Oxalobacteraceae bacterium R-40]|uniref:Cd(II)/Pb(II)-responsive transcriptional regulator n=1 Tax=Keguizhuia sedimenti TaxID=3064264 RepID=A0ABU1BU56_9BURK|nr:Cd(II)/Pb(II)-responsive transcriptional regulator [Oxalobacteraceae bacterium R-40]
MAPQFMKIGEMAKRIGSPVETIRYYEREGLLPAPMRSEGNYRLYGSSHLERLQFIRHCRSLDMSLDEIRSLLAFRDSPEESCEVVNELLDKHIGHVAGRIRELQDLQKQLEALRNLCHTTQAARDCEIMQSLASTDDVVPTKLGTHGGGCH